MFHHLKQELLQIKKVAAKGTGALATGTAPSAAETAPPASVKEYFRDIEKQLYRL
jgi:hypothetical protein